MIEVLPLFLLFLGPYKIENNGEFLVEMSGNLKTELNYVLSGYSGHNRFYIIDKNIVHIFDERGRKMKTLDQPGEGPGEFDYPNAAIYDGEFYMISTGLQHRVHLYDNAFRWVGQTKERYEDLHFVSPHIILAQNMDEISQDRKDANALSYIRSKLCGKQVKAVTNKDLECPLDEGDIRYAYSDRNLAWKLAIPGLYIGLEEEEMILASMVDPYLTNLNDGSKIEIQLKGYETLDFPSSRDVNEMMKELDESKSSLIFRFGIVGEFLYYIYTSNEYGGFVFGIQKGIRGESKSFPLKGKKLFLWGDNGEEIFFIEDSTTKKSFDYDYWLKKKKPEVIWANGL